MRKSLALLIVLTCITFGGITNTCKAQTGMTFGIRGGVNFANFNNTDSDFSSRTGFMAGGYFNFALPNSPISIQPEILYTQKGAKFDDVTSGTIKIDYIEVPVLAKFDYVANGPVTPNVYFGPYVGFNVRSELPREPVYTNPDKSYPDPNEDYYPSETKSTDIGVTVGAGIDISKFNIGARYDAGLTKTFKDNDIKNSVFSIVAGIDF